MTFLVSFALTDQSVREASVIAYSYFIFRGS